MLIEELIKSLSEGLENRPLTVSQVHIGVFYTAVQLSDGAVGVAFTPRDMDDSVCCPRSAAEMPRAGKLSGQGAWELADEALSINRLRRSVGLAALNALSSLLVAEKEIPGARTLINADALDAVNIDQDEKVVLVGAFVPFIKKLKERGIRQRVIDKHPKALKPEELAFWVSPDSASNVLSEADIAIITGSALVEGGLEELLASCKKAHDILLAGPTASFWPVPFFKHGITVMAGIRINDGVALMRLVAEGGSGYFFDGPAEKMAIVRDNSSR
jgi:uncharacterized protein (DUF4213/DUF364 family)